MNVSSAVSPSASVARHVYVVAACATVGVPSSCSDAFTARPAGPPPTSSCVSGAFPPDQADTDPAFGSGVTIGNQVYVKDVAIAALQLPAASGGNAPLTHELVGGGPAGLAVNASLQLEGTPTVAQAATTYTWRATDADGDTAELTFTIEVQADTDPAFGSGVTIGNQVYVKDVAIAALQLPAASGGTRR